MDFWSLIFELCMGFGNTLKLFALTLVFAIPLGLAFSLISVSKFKPLSWLMKTVIWVIRGTPLLLQGLLVTWIPYCLDIKTKTIAEFFHVGVADTTFVLVLIAFVINYSCYFAVIFEGGIKNISVGQQEAGQVLGMTKGQIFKNIIFLQVVRKILAPMSNEIITLVKDTALAKALMLNEILFVAFSVVNREVVLYPLVYAAVFYMLFTGVLTILFHYIEKKLSYYTV